ncbi:MAG: hypothetical protein AB1758_03550 [Candidatus Eremiobacterota bacterium]
MRVQTLTMPIRGGWPLPMRASGPAPVDRAELSGGIPRWRDRLAGGLFLAACAASAAVSPWLGAGLLTLSLAAARPRLSQGMSRAEGALGRLGRALVDGMADTMDQWAEAHRKTPEEGPAREEHFLRKFLRDAERTFGKDSIYTLGQRLRLADFYRQSHQGIQVAEGYDRAVNILDAEIEARGGAVELDRLVPACATGYPDSASVFQRAGEFFLLYAQPEKAVELLRRALELAPAGGRRIELLERLAGDVPDSEAVALRREAFRLRLKGGYPTDPSLGGPARALAQSLEKTGQEAGGWYALSFLLDCARLPATESLRAGHLKELGDLYARVGEADVAADLRDQAEICRLESSARGTPAGPALRRDLEGLIELYQRRGEESALVRTRHRLEAVKARCAGGRAG